MSVPCRLNRRQLFGGFVKYTEAFAYYSATLRDHRRAYSAIARDGSLVLSCWGHRFKFRPCGALRYADKFSRWVLNSYGSYGKSRLQNHLRQAFEGGLSVRLVIATAGDPNAIDEGRDASRASNTWDVRNDLSGRVVELTTEGFAVDF